MRYHTEAITLERFDPESDGYDYQAAIDSGNIADEKTKHWGSIDPRTGMVLKGKNHPTWNQMIEEEVKLGNTVIKADNGRYYSVKLPKYLSEAKIAEPETGFEDNTQNVLERANRDFDFAVENNLPLDFFDALKREWATQSGFVRKIPFFGGFAGFAENRKTAAAAERISKKWDYATPIGFKDEVSERMSGRMAKGDIEYDPYVGSIYADKESDEKIVSAYLKYISTDKTVMNKIATGASALPTWAVEFWVTGGLASLGDDAARKAGEKILGAYAKTTAGKMAMWSAQISAGGVTRSAGLGHQVLEKMSQRQLDAVLGLREEEGWAMSALVAWGDTVIEAASESAGEGLTTAGGVVLGKLPFGSKVVPALEKAWIAATGGTKGEFARKLFSKGGYSNILGEIGEERIGTILRAVTEVDDFGLGKDASMIDRLKTGLLQDIHNIGVEIGVLSVPMAGQFVLSQVAELGRVKPDFDYTQFDQKEQLEPTPSAEVIEDITAGTEGKAVLEGTGETMPPAPTAEGEIWYHGTPSEVLNFGKASKGNELPFGVHFTQNKALAEDFASGITKGKPTGKTGRIIETKLNIKNPLDIQKGIYKEGTKEFDVLSEIAKRSGLTNVIRPYKDGNFVGQALYTNGTKAELPEGTINAINPKEVLNSAKLSAIKAVLKENGYDQAIKYSMFGTRDPMGMGAPEYTQAVAILDSKLIPSQPPTEKPAEKPKEPEITKPVTIETANTSKEIDEIAKQIISQGIDPTKTSARQADLQEDRASLGLDGIASAERKAWQVSLQQAKDRNIINSALRIAAEINANPRPLNDVETAGLVMKAAQLKREHKSLMQEMDNLTEKVDIDSKAAQIDTVEKEFDALTQAIYRSGTEKGRALASQKLTINQDFDLLSLKNRAKKMKGRELTEKETAALEERAKALDVREKLIAQREKQINEKQVKRIIKEGSISRYAKMNRSEIDLELDSLVSRTKQLIKEGCLN
jgi:hypothetical protein